MPLAVIRVCPCSLSGLSNLESTRWIQFDDLELVDLCGYWFIAAKISHWDYCGGAWGPQVGNWRRSYESETSPTHQPWNSWNVKHVATENPWNSVKLEAPKNPEHRTRNPPDPAWCPKRMLVINWNTNATNEESEPGLGQESRAFLESRDVAAQRFWLNAVDITATVTECLAERQLPVYLCDCNVSPLESKNLQGFLIDFDDIAPHNGNIGSLPRWNVAAFQILIPEHPKGSREWWIHHCASLVQNLEMLRGNQEIPPVSVIIRRSSMATSCCYLSGWRNPI